VRVKKSGLSLSCDLEGLDTGTAAVRSKVTALVKRAPPGVKKCIRGWNEENYVFNPELLYSSCLIKVKVNAVFCLLYRGTGLWDNSCLIKSHSACEEGAPGSEKNYKRME
jgi:hypothetical protein